MIFRTDLNYQPIPSDTLCHVCVTTCLYLKLFKFFSNSDDLQITGKNSAVDEQYVLPNAKLHIKLSLQLRLLLFSYAVRSVMFSSVSHIMPPRETVVVRQKRRLCGV